MLLAHAGHQPAHAYAVAAHYGVDAVALFIVIGHAHGFGVAAAKLEYVADLYAVFNGKRMLAALGAYAAHGRLGNVHIFGIRHVPIHVEPCEVVAFFIRAAYKVPCAFKRTIVHHGYTLGGVYGAYRARNKAGVVYFNGGMHLRLKIVPQLGFVNLKVAAHEYQNVAVVLVALIHNGLGALFRAAVQKAAHILNGLVVIRCNLFKRGHGFIGVVMHYAVRRLHVRAVAALRAKDDGILANIGKQHELVANLAAHHARIGRNGNDFRYAYAGIYALIRAVAALIIPLQILLRGMERIAVLHCKFAHPYKAAAGTGLVAELGLYLIYHKGVLLICARHVHGHMHGRFFMSHAKHHIRAAPVLKAQKLLADAFPAAGSLPKRCGHSNGEQYLLPVYPVHLLAQYRLYLIMYTPRGRHKGIYAVAHLLNIAAPYHKVLAFYFRNPVLIPFA